MVRQTIRLRKVKAIRQTGPAIFLMGPQVDVASLGGVMAKIRYWSAHCLLNTSAVG